MTVTLSGCPGGIQYIHQPHTELNCNPMGNFIGLLCTIQQANGFANNVTWYWSRCDQDAGVNGTAILPEDRTDAYGIQQSHASFSINITSSALAFQVTNTTLGYYWCEVNSSSSRPSIIAHVLQPTNTSLPVCTGLPFNMNQNLRPDPECADEDSPTVYPRVPLPSFCPSVQNPTDDDTIVFGATFTRIQTIVLLAAIGAVIVLLVLVILILCVCLCCKSRRFVIIIALLLIIECFSPMQNQEESVTARDDAEGLASSYRQT